MSEIPSDLYYTADHEWVRRTGDDTVRVGITDYAQAALGDVVFVELPDVGAEVTAGGEFGNVESTKSKSDSTRRSPRKSLRSTAIWPTPRSWSTPTRTAPAGSSNCRSTPHRCPRRWTACSTPTRYGATLDE